MNRFAFCSALLTLILSGCTSIDVNSGFGSSNMSAEFSNGIITKVGQTSGSKTPADLASIAALKTAGMLVEGQEPTCEPTARLYAIENGVPRTNSPINFMIDR